MPPIAIHLDDPIKPPAIEPTNVPTKTVTTTVNQVVNPPPDQNSNYPAARPGAAAAPAPTGYIAPPHAPPPTQTIPESLPASQTHNGPPPPQPGAVPIASQNAFQAPVTATQNSITPAPPHPGAIPSLPASAAIGPPPSSKTTAALAGASQIPPPTTALPNNPYAPPPAITSPAAAGGHPGPTTLNLGPVSAMQEPNHAGYQQNVYAQDLTSGQRSSLAEQERREHGNGSLAGLGGIGAIGGGGGSGQGAAGENLAASVGEAAGSAWNVVKGWAGVAGERLAEGEKKVWQTINKS